MEHGLIICERCNGVYESARGLSSHQRTCNPEPASSPILRLTVSPLLPQLSPQALPQNPPPSPSQHVCTICLEQPAVLWPCCGAWVACVACTRVTRGALEPPHRDGPRSGHASNQRPYPVCPICRADYNPEDLLRYCVICQLPTEPVATVQVREILENGLGVNILTRTAPNIDIDSIWTALDCCGSRIHTACQPRLQRVEGENRCPLCVSDYCAACHRQCDSSCRPRAIGSYPNTSTTYQRCQPEGGLSHRLCGHSTCLEHTFSHCLICPQPETQTQPPARQSQVELPITRTLADPYSYNCDLFLCSICGSQRNVFECRTCGRENVPNVGFNPHLSDLFHALHNHYVIFTSAMNGTLHGALNAQSRLQTACPTCGMLSGKQNADNPACDAIICRCNAAFCFYCVTFIPGTQYHQSGHGQHFGPRPVGMPGSTSNGWCTFRSTRPPQPTTVRPPRPTTVRAIPNTAATTVNTTVAATNISTSPVLSRARLPSVSPTLTTTTALAVTPTTTTAPTTPPTSTPSTTPTTTTTPTLPTTAAPPRAASTTTATPTPVRRNQGNRRNRHINEALPIVTPAPAPQRVISSFPPRPIAAPSSHPTTKAQVLTYVPKNLWELFKEVCRPILADLERAISSRDVHRIEPLLREFLEVPKHTLLKKRGGRRLEGSLAAQMRTASATRPTQAPSPMPMVPELLFPQAADAQSHASSDVTQPAQEIKSNLPVAAIRRAIGLTLSNHASRAVRTVYQDALPQVTPLIERQLEQLHPQAPPDSVIPPLPTNAPFVPVIPDDRFIRVWKNKVATGASAAASGFSGDHGLPLLEDRHCIRGLAAVIQLIRNGQLNERCRSLLLSCPVLPTVKPNGGTRPVTMGETLYKMAAAHALDEVEDIAKGLVGTDQFALIAGGPEVATLVLKVALETRTGVSTDIHNAFNSLDRALMMRELFSHAGLAPIWRLAHMVYSQRFNCSFMETMETFFALFSLPVGPSKVSRSRPSCIVSPQSRWSMRRRRKGGLKCRQCA